jgi:Uma2 family endonuclease
MSKGDLCYDERSLVERFFTMAFEKIQEEKAIPLADFLRDFDKAPFELIYGRRIPIMVSLAGHTMLIYAILEILKAFVLANQLGIVLSEATIVEEARKNWVKGSFTPDLLFFSAERFQQYIEENSDWEDKPFVLVPDIAIEVVSKNDSYSAINEKVLAYLEIGVKEIWVIDPQAKNALIHIPKKTQILKKEESIQSDLLPNFELKLSDLFSKTSKNKKS